MKKCFLLLLLVVFLNIDIYGQTCNCTTNFKWLKETFEANDAGFSYVIKKKGQRSYDYLNQEILKRAEATNSFTVCRELMTEWLRFFRKFHLSVSLSDEIAKAESAKFIKEFNQNLANIPQSTFDNHEKYIISDDKWDLYLSKLNMESMEGTWSSPPYTIGIIKTVAGYSGFVISAPGTPFKKGDIKLKIDRAGSGFTGTTYSKDFKPFYNASVLYNAAGPNYLSVGSLSLKRLAPIYTDPPELEAYRRAMYSEVPLLEKLSNRTAYLRIPSFDISQKKTIDSVVLRGKKLLSSSKNLIIDLRGNGGGSDLAYQQLLPFINTNTIRYMAVEYKSTPLNNAAASKIVEDPLFDKVTRDYYKKGLDTLQKYIGEFVMLEKNTVTIDTIGIKLKNPETIILLVDANTGSSAEQFVVDARQSLKVKVYGRPTLGSLDISNMNMVTSPSGEFILRYGTSKSLRIPDYQIDDIGLMPDVYLDATVPAYKWVPFVQKVIEISN